MSPSPSPSPIRRVPTGVPGLDEVLRGGFPAGRVFLLHGGPGTGKTTMGFQFLLDGLRRGERVLYITLLQSADELDELVRSHGWSLDGIDIVELTEEVRETAPADQTFFSSADLEFHQVTDTISQAIEERRPQRLVFDSISELSILIDNPAQLRRQLMRLKTQLYQSGCTAMVNISEGEVEEMASLQTIVHGVVRLSMETPDYGPSARKLEVTKVRGIEFAKGLHDFRIRTGGLEVFPRLEASREGDRPSWEVVRSGNEELDALLGGGLETGTSCLLAGPTGTGKSTLAALYAQGAAERGSRSLVFCFDERRDTFLHRAAGLGLEVPRYVEEGLISLNEVGVGELSPGEFVHRIRRAVDGEGVKVLVIDSLTGYQQAMLGHHRLMVQLHELLAYLAGRGVLTFLITTSRGWPDEASVSADGSYLADTVVLLRHFEAGGAVRRCVSVIKKRYGPHETTIREIWSDVGGVRVGSPLTRFTNVLAGTPAFLGDPAGLMERGVGLGPEEDT